MSSILLTGGAGFIGSNVANYLYEKGYQRIVVLDKIDICSNTKNLIPEIKLIKGDICNADLVNHILDEYKIDTIIHFAAATHVCNSMYDSLNFTQSNIVGTHMLLECSKIYGKLKLFIHFSTDEVYGEKSYTSNKASTENDKLEPTNPYASTKASAEHLVNSYRISFKLPTIITRCNNIFGIKQYPEKIIPKFITRLSQDKSCELHGDGTNKRSYLHVDDVSKGIELILNKGKIGEIYNIGSDIEYQNIDVWKNIITIFREKYPNYLSNSDDNHYLSYIRDRDFNDKRYWIDCSEMMKLGWKQEKTNFKDELKEIIKWYIENPKYWLNIEKALLGHQS
jgi:dTDP-glucose 4,6-dehydratase